MKNAQNNTTSGRSPKQEALNYTNAEQQIKREAELDRIITLRVLLHDEVYFK